MLKMTRTYTDFNGVERTEDFYFNFTKAEMIDMKYSREGGFENYLQKVIDAKDQNEIVKLFKDLVLQAYGEKSEDGRRFVKSKEISEAFSQTEAYSDIFMELASDEKKAADFVNGILPDIQRDDAHPDIKRISGGSEN